MNGLIPVIHLPEAYAVYWVQPTAALTLMRLYTSTMDMYAGAYQRTCKALERERVNGSKKSAAKKDRGSFPRPFVIEIRFQLMAIHLHRDWFHSVWP